MAHIMCQVLHIASRILPVAYSLSHIACRISRVAYSVSHIACRISPVAYRVSQITSRISRLAYRVSHTASRIPRLAYRVSHIACRISRLAYRLSHIACPISHVAYSVSLQNCNHQTELIFSKHVQLLRHVGRVLVYARVKVEKVSKSPKMFQRRLAGLKRENRSNRLSIFPMIQLSLLLQFMTAGATYIYLFNDVMHFANFSVPLSFILGNLFRLYVLCSLTVQSIVAHKFKKRNC
uniref:Uncharacterized protein n=1 Tax=Glossina brevipalpis TaxID=37001 RepID=A0A1A9WGY7_9MUSC